MISQSAKLLKHQQGYAPYSRVPVRSPGRADDDVEDDDDLRHQEWSLELEVPKEVSARG